MAACQANGRRAEQRLAQLDEACDLALTAGIEPNFLVAMAYARDFPVEDLPEKLRLLAGIEVEGPSQYDQAITAIGANDFQAALIASVLAVADELRHLRTDRSGDLNGDMTNQPAR